MKQKYHIKKILFLENADEYHTYVKNFQSTLKQFCKKLISFNRRDYYLKYGKDVLNKKLLEVIKKEKPDYVFTWITWDEFFLDTLLKIKELSPNTKTVAIFGDDSSDFINFSRYYCLFFDYCFTTLKSYLPKYKRDGITTVFSTNLTDTNQFRYLNLEKKFDVTFIGTQKTDQSGRYQILKFLKDKGVKLRIYGFGWDDYQEFKDINKGPLKDEEVIKIINESKINLCLSKDGYGQPQLKARVFEIGACKSFVLCEYAREYLDYFKKNKEITLFHSPEELLEKIDYYLSNEKEREKLATNLFEVVKKKYGLYNELDYFFSSTQDNLKHKHLPLIDQKVFRINKGHMCLSISELRKRLNSVHYICFDTECSESLKYKEYIQSYGLEKTGKPIVCCDYYAYSKNLGDYTMFYSKYAVTTLSKQLYGRLFNLAQLMVTKDFFLENLEKFNKVFNGSNLDFISAENTAFISMPLVRIKDFKLQNYDVYKNCFSFKFIFKLYSLLYQKKFFNLYPVFLLAELFKGKKFILDCLVETFFNKSLWIKFKKFNSN